MLGVHLSFQISVFVFFRKIPKNGITGPYDSSTFNFLRNLHIVFHSGYTSLHSHHQCMWVPFSSHHCQHLLFIVFLIIRAILTGVKWCLILGQICIFLMICASFHVSASICMSSLGKCLLRSFAHFLIRLFFWCWVFCLFWILTLYQIYHL